MWEKGSCCGFPGPHAGLTPSSPRLLTNYGKTHVYGHLIDDSVVDLARIYVRSLPSSPGVVCSLLTCDSDEFKFFKNLACIVAPTLQNAIFKLSLFCERNSSVFCLSKTRVLGKTGGKRAFMFCQVIGVQSWYQITAVWGRGWEWTPRIRSASLNL